MGQVVLQSPQPMHVSGLMRTTWPTSMNGGTRTRAPVSTVASLSWLVAVAFLMPGGVSVTSRSTAAGSSIVSGLPLKNSPTMVVLGFT